MLDDMWSQGISPSSETPSALPLARTELVLINRNVGLWTPSDPSDLAAYETADRHRRYARYLWLMIFARAREGSEGELAQLVM